MEKRTIFQIIAISTIIICFMWAAGWLAAFFSIIPKTLTNQPLSDAFSSIDALFGGLAFAGVIITIIMQMSELEESRLSQHEALEATKSIAETNLLLSTRADEKYILDLFQTYCSDYFQMVKDDSQKVLFSAIGSRAYCDFAVSRLFAADPLDFPKQSLQKLRQIHGLTEEQASDDEIMQIDQRCRYKFDELLNFFTLLTSGSNTKEIISRCDFSYAFWRPYFWMVATKQHNRYENNENIKQYVTKPFFKEIVIKLDSIYDFAPFTNDDDMWEFFKNHPKIKPYLDKEFFNTPHSHG